MASNSNKFVSFFTTDHVPRWQIMVFGLFVIGLTFLQQQHFYNKSREDTLSKAHVERIEAKLLDVQRHSVEFQTYAGAFVSSILDNDNDIDGKRSELIDNILAQDAAIDVSMALFDPKTQSAVSNYRTSLREMRNAVDQVTDVVSMGLFWEAASNLLVSRNAVLKALEEQISTTS